MILIRFKSILNIFVIHFQTCQNLPNELPRGNSLGTFGNSLVGTALAADPREVYTAMGRISPPLSLAMDGELLLKITKLVTIL